MPKKKNPKPKWVDMTPAQQQEHADKIRAGMEWARIKRQRLMKTVTPEDFDFSQVARRIMEDEPQFNIHNKLVDEERALIVLQTLAEGRSQSMAADKAGISIRTLVQWRQRNEVLDKAITLAMEIGTDRLEDEAVRRAVDGVDEPVFQGGELVGFQRRYSDRMMELMLKARRPRVYLERVAQLNFDGDRADKQQSPQDVEEGNASARELLASRISSVTERLRQGGSVGVIDGGTGGKPAMGLAVLGKTKSAGS